MKRLRPSIRKMEKEERAAGGDVYAIHRAATDLILARLTAALDRIRVAGAFAEFSGGTVAQLRHAQRFIAHGTPHEVERLASLQVFDDTAADLTRILADIFHDALVAELLVRRSERAATCAEVRKSDAVAER